MTQDKAPEWAIREAEALTGKVTSYSRQVGAIALALSKGYERGQESMRERASKELDAWKMPKASDKVRALPIEQEGWE